MSNYMVHHIKKILHSHSENFGTGPISKGWHSVSSYSLWTDINLLEAKTMNSNRSEKSEHERSSPTRYFPFRKVRMIVMATFITGSISLVQAQQGSLKPQTSAPAVDPVAVKLLRGMTDYLSGLKQFSVHVRNAREDMLDSGHRVDFEISAKLIINRPDKLHSTRLGHLVDQDFYYDGKVLTLYNQSHKVYAAVPAPGTIEETLDFARESLGIEQPVADLVYRNAFPLLMHDVTLAMVVDKEVIAGVKCNHLLFSRPGVDFQVWVADDGPPLPQKYVVTDTGTPELLSITATMSDWNVAPTVADAQFTFVPPQGVKKISFMPVDASSGPPR